MSYILDALKKSEQERGHGNVPGVQTIHSSSLSYRTEQRSVWPYILIAAVVINIGLVIYFNLEKKNPTPEITDSSSSLATGNIQPRAEIKAVPGIAMTTNQSHSREPNQQGEPMIVGTTSPANNHKASQQQSAAPVKPVTVSAQAAPSAEQEAVAQSAAPAAAGTASGETGPVSNDETGPISQQSSAGSASPAGVIDYSELPQATRNGLPAIIISAHVYSSNPQQRSIVINNNFMEEGEYLIDGLILHEITREGAILNYQGTLFHYGAVSSWR